MYTVMMAARISQPSLACEASNARAVPWNRTWMLGGIPISATAAVDRAAPLRPANSRPPRLKETVTAGNWPWWLIASGPVARSRSVQSR